MKLKKILAGLMVGAFAFGVVFSDVSAANDNQPDKKVQAQGEMKQPPQSNDGKNPPEPPKDSNGKPLPPPDKQNGDKNQSGDGKNPPEPPKDSNGNPLPPPDQNGDKNSQTQQPRDNQQQRK